MSRDVTSGAALVAFPSHPDRGLDRGFDDALYRTFRRG